MSIVSEQLIGSWATVTFDSHGRPEQSSLPERDPFSVPDPSAPPTVGFSGYTYAPTTELLNRFRATHPDERVGPDGRDANNLLTQTTKNTQYGYEGTGMPSDMKTILGEMAEMIKPPKEGTAVPEWNTDGDGPKMAYTFFGIENRSLKSLNDLQTEGLRPMASGGWKRGYDANTHYGVTNWLAGGGTGTAGSAAKAAVWEGGVGTSEILEEEVAAVAAVQSREIFREPATEAKTGLINLPEYAAAVVEP